MIQQSRGTSSAWKPSARKLVLDASYWAQSRNQYRVVNNSDAYCQVAREFTDRNRDWLDVVMSAAQARFKASDRTDAEARLHEAAIASPLYTIHGTASADLTHYRGPLDDQAALDAQWTAIVVGPGRDEPNPRPVEARRGTDARMNTL